MSRKRALIIGNNDYEHEKLKKCVKNAKDFADVLKQMRTCDVELQINLKSQDLYHSIHNFIISTQPNDFIIFYFSGHAIRWRDQNFLLPCDNNNITNATNINHYAINAQPIIDDIAGMNPRVVVFLLDCCRSYSMPAMKSNELLTNKQIYGLNEMKAPENTLIAFSCAVGQVLSNQAQFENNELFTKYLIKHITTMNVHIETILFKVANDIVQETQNVQRPYRVGHLNTEVFLIEHIANIQKELNKKSSLSNVSTISSLKNDKEIISVHPNVHNINLEYKDARIIEPNLNVSSRSEQRETSLKLDRMKTDNNIIERKAIDVSGQLGTTYNASDDKLGSQNSVRGTKVETLRKGSICKVFSGNRSIDLINYFEKMDFNDALRLSLLLQMIQPSGVSSFINYNQPIDENTRFLYYSYINKIEELEFTPEDAAQIMTRPRYPTSVTHVITKIHYGIEILCVTQIPNDKSLEIMDNLLQSISTRLENNKNEFILKSNEAFQIDQLKNVTIYGSQRCINYTKTSLRSILTELSRWQRDEWYHHPLLYTMHSLRWIYKDNQFANILDMTDKMNSSTRKIQSIITDINAMNIELKILLKICSQNNSNRRLNQQLIHFQSTFSSLVQIYKQFLKNSQEVVIKLRRNACESKEIDTILSDQRYLSLKTDLDTLYKSVQQWFNKVKLIERLKNDQIEYTELLEIVPEALKLKTFEEINAVLKSKFTRTSDSVILFYSNDQLKQRNEVEWEKKYQQFKLEKRKTTIRIILIYIDFIQFEQVLQDFTIVPLPDQKLSIPTIENSARSPKLTGASPSPRSLSPSPTEFNLLLLGETGVGKSTFINAFVNYLTYETLEQAEQNEPAVVIPVSFITTTGDNFDEVIVKFGDKDSNENFQIKGESVTQHCRSYIFDINKGLRLRLIDTPGIGDTRGLDQDEINMNNVLTYINQLSHINAVCLLLKPTVSRLDGFFRSCVRHLLTYLTPNGYGNILFCFTNARSTHFNSGNTGLLLKQMLKQVEFNGIQFEKNNTFYFDSESFRYLASKKCNVNFEDYIKKESIKSWEKSVNESLRMLNFIRTLQPYYFNAYISLKKVLLDVFMLAGPLMEKLRLIFYNWVLLENGWKFSVIIKKTNNVNTKICSNCAKCSVKKIGVFHILEYESVKHKDISYCHCPYNEKHSLIECTVEHYYRSYQMATTIGQLEKTVHELLFKYDQLIHFLQTNGLMNKNDLLSIVLEQFLDDEKYIYGKFEKTAELNRQMYAKLYSLLNLRAENRKKLIELNENLSVDQIYKIINDLMSIPEIKEQVECIKISRQLLMKATEQQVKNPRTINKNFTVLTN